MKKKWMYVLLLILVVNVISGCWSRKELNKLAIVVGIGIDKQEGQYLISAQAVNPGEIGEKGHGEAPVTTYKIQAPTTSEALRKITTISPRRLYMSHLRVLIIGEDIAKQGMQDILDYFQRSYEFRPDFYVLVAKNHKAKDILSIFTNLERIPANKIFSSIDTSFKFWAPTTVTYLDEFIKDMVNPGKDAVLPGIQLLGDEKKGKMKLKVEIIDSPARLFNSSIAVFKKDKLVGWLNEQESKGYNYITDNVHMTAGHVELPKGGKAVVEVIRSKSTIKAIVKKGKPQIQVKITLEGNVGEVEGSINFLEPKSVQEVEKATEQKVKTKTEQAINKAQKQLKSDIFGFGNAINGEYPKVWESLLKDWDKHFADLPVTVMVDAKLRHIGRINNPVIEELKKK